jgi:hypothetical protein
MMCVGGLNVACLFVENEAVELESTGLISDNLLGLSSVDIGQRRDVLSATT